MNDLYAELMRERFTRHERVDHPGVDNDIACGRRRRALLEALGGEAAA